ncbi:MAG: hypothetical protein IPK16_19350 [Anaerolineales bacterium]|nr:hypothetical protein [Anaerolineales bacterium]
MQKQRLDERSRRLNAAIARRVERATDLHSALVQQLESLSPQRVLERGYSIVQRSDGVVVRGPHDATAGAQLKVRAAAGEYSVQKLGDAPPAN